jgi:ketosteroid isomerase-like protein
MKKKIGFNIILFVFITGSILILSCKGKSYRMAGGVLLKADREFSEMSVKEGMHKAFLAYVAGDGVILRNGAYPSKGRETLRKRFEGKSDSSFTLSWEPLAEFISESGEMGYTYGIYKSMDKPSGNVTNGTYVTIWHRQPDGSWKFVLDTGTEGLPDTK